MRKKGGTLTRLHNKGARAKKIKDREKWVTYVYGKKGRRSKLKRNKDI